MNYELLYHSNFNKNLIFYITMHESYLYLNITLHKSNNNFARSKLIKHTISFQLYQYGLTNGAITLSA